MNERLRNWLRALSRPTDDMDTRTDPHDLEALDARMGSLEREQVEIAARLLLLERAADPRGHRHRE